MHRRPLNSRFNEAVISGRKFTTIRDNEWPVGQPIMLYNWSGPPYRSKQIDVATIMVIVAQRIDIHHKEDGTMHFYYPADYTLWEAEGFDSQEDMDQWFRAKTKPGQFLTKPLMRFRLLEPHDIRIDRKYRSVQSA